MIKRNLSSICLVIAMALVLPNFWLSENQVMPIQFWLSVGASLVLVGALTTIIINETQQKDE